MGGESRVYIWYARTLQERVWFGRINLNGMVGLEMLCILLVGYGMVRYGEVEYCMQCNAMTWHCLVVSVMVGSGRIG